MDWVQNVYKRQKLNKRLRWAFLSPSTSPLPINPGPLVSSQHWAPGGKTASWQRHGWACLSSSPQTLCGMTLTKSFPPHTQRHASTHSFPFNPDGHLLGGSGLCGLWHSNLPCWLCQERKVPTALCPGRFAGLCLQQAGLRDVIMSPSGTKRRLAYCLPQRFPRPVFLSYDTRHSIHLAHSVTSMGLRGRETDTHWCLHS